MTDKTRIVGDISAEAARKFSLIKGFYHAKSAGEVIEKLVEIVEPIVIRKITNKR